MSNVVLDPATYSRLVASFKVTQPWLKFILPKIALFFDKIHCFGDIHEIDLLQDKPYGLFSSEMTKELLDSVSEYSRPTQQQLEDLQLALDGRTESGGGFYAYYLIRGMLDFCRKNQYYLYIFPGHRERFINFCIKYHPDYLSLMKESFLLCNLLEFVYEQYIPALDPIESKDVLKDFFDYKEDFQKGVYEYLALFKGSYMLSKNQKEHIKETLANDERKLLEFLQPENLKKYGVLKDIIGETIGEVISHFAGIPLDLILSIGQKIKKLRAFHESKLDFILSLTILKKMTNIGKEDRTINCAVCALSIAEIENMSDKECMDLVYHQELCIEHMVARLDLKKRFMLWGKSLLKAMKKYGDSSVFINE